MKADICPIEGIFFSFVQANGIHHRLASTVPDLTPMGAQAAKSQGFPLVLFLHGFPELWYSWRFQLLFLKNRPYLAVAPDMRGFGATDQPVPIHDYTQPVVAEDVVAIARSLGYEQFILVGHDWGCQTAWSVALLSPESVLGVFGMSVPYAGTPKSDMLTMLEARYGCCIDQSIPRQVRQKAKFHYILHHCLPHSSAEYDRNTRELLFRLYCFRPGCEIEEGTPEFDIHDNMFTLADPLDDTGALDATTAPGLWKRIPRPKTFPNWLKKDDLEYFAQQYEHSGFHGGLCWYRALKLNYSLMKNALMQTDGTMKDKIHAPSLFLVGERDELIKMYGGKEKVTKRLCTYLPNLLQQPIFIPNAGHWIQGEAREYVNETLLQFLDAIIELGSRTNVDRSRL
jgi:pimeloyl-ACP methyl ester carboxylesterase